MQAATAKRIKANNTANLNSNASWTTITPSVSEIGLWNATVTAANTVALGSDRAWLGMEIADPAGPVTISAGDTLTLGYSGIEMQAATQDLTISSGLMLLTGHGQQWDVAAGKTLTLNIRRGVKWTDGKPLTAADVVYSLTTGK